MPALAASTRGCAGIREQEIFIFPELEGTVTALVANEHKIFTTAGPQLPARLRNDPNHKPICRTLCVQDSSCIFNLAGARYAAVGLD